MGNFSENLVKKIAPLKEILNQPVPSFLEDPAAGIRYSQKQADADYVLRTLSSKLASLIQRLPAEPMYLFYFKNTTDEQKESFSSNAFTNDMNAAKPSGDWLLDEKRFGKSGWQGTLQALEAALGQAGIDTDAEQEALMQIYPPTDPQFPEAQRTECPEKPILDGLRDQIAPGSPDAQRKLDLLDRAEKLLTTTSGEYLAHLNAKVSGSEERPGLDDQAKLHHANNLLRFTKRFEKGRFENKLPTGTAVGPFKRYDATFTMQDTPLTKEDREVLRKQPSPFNPELRQRILQVTDAMDAMGLEEYRNSEATSTLRAPLGQKRMFEAEQGEKMYAFIPLINAKLRLADALLEGDYEEIEKACAKCEEYKVQTDLIIKTVQKGHAPTFGEALNSTRPLSNRINRIPPEYAADHVGHSRANGLQLLYGFSKNNNIPVEELLKDPVNKIEEAGRSYIADYGLSKQGKPGEKLYRALCSLAADAFMSQWITNVNLIQRSMTSAAGMASSQQEAENIEGVGFLGGTLSMLPVRKEAAIWHKLANADAQRKDALYRCFLLLPEDELDPRALAEIVTDKDHQKKLKLEDMVNQLRNAKKLDLSALAKRAGDILAQAEETKTAYGDFIKSAFNPTAFKKQCLEVFRHVLHAATPEEKGTAGYLELKKAEIEFKNSLLADPLTADAEYPKNSQVLTPLLDTLERNLGILTQRKKGAFLSSTNSDEHIRMTRAQTRLSLKLKQLKGEPLPEQLSEAERKKLEAADLADVLHRARAATYEYCRIKGKNGTKTSFVHGVGMERANAAEDSIDAMDKLAEKMHLGSPADQALDRVRFALLQMRADKEQLEERGEDLVAAMIYSMGVYHKHLPAEKEQELMNQQKLNAGVARIQDNKAFQKMVEDEGLDKLAEYAIKGGGRLTNAWLKALEAQKPNAQRVNPEQMSLEDKVNFWKQTDVGRR